MSNTVSFYIIGMLFTWGLCASHPNWDQVTTAKQYNMVILWPITIGKVVYTNLLQVEEYDAV